MESFDSDHFDEGPHEDLSPADDDPAAFDGPTPEPDVGEPSEVSGGVSPDDAATEWPADHPSTEAGAPPADTGVPDSRELSFPDPLGAPDADISVSDPASPDLPNFDPSEASAIAGDPADEMGHWHEQERADSCAVASQEFVLESLTGEHWSERQLVQEATDNGWYTPGGGTSLEDTGRLLEAHGIPVERSFGEGLGDLQQRLDDGQKVIVAVDADETWSPGQDALADDLLDDSTGIPGQDANHAVEVIGFAQTDSGTMVVLNDPGHPDGKGVMIPALEFEDAWHDSGNYAVAAGTGVHPDTAGAELRSAGGPGLGYSYSSGETVDGDPVSYSTREDRYYDERTWETAEPV